MQQTTKKQYKNTHVLQKCRVERVWWSRDLIESFLILILFDLVLTEWSNDDLECEEISNISNGYLLLFYESINHLISSELDLFALRWAEERTYRACELHLPNSKSILHYNERILRIFKYYIYIYFFSIFCGVFYVRTKEVLNLSFFTLLFS